MNEEDEAERGRLNDAAEALRSPPADSGTSDLLARLIEIAEANAATADRHNAQLAKAASDIARLEAWAREHRSP